MGEDGWGKDAQFFFFPFPLYRVGMGRGGSPQLPNYISTQGRRCLLDVIVKIPMWKNKMFQGNCLNRIWESWDAVGFTATRLRKNPSNIHWLMESTLVLQSRTLACCPQYRYHQWRRPSLETCIVELDHKAYDSPCDWSFESSGLFGESPNRDLYLHMPCSTGSSSVLHV